MFTDFRRDRTTRKDEAQDSTLRRWSAISSQITPVSAHAPAKTVEPEAPEASVETPPIAADSEPKPAEEPKRKPEPEAHEVPPQVKRPARSVDYYEVLQISRNADEDTIHRVYRIMASRFHPDNPSTGDAERFLLMTRAFQVLSDPAKRLRYDAQLIDDDAEPLTVFQLKDFVDGVDGEINRRLGVLSLLYHRRRSQPGTPGISVLDLEKRMAFPREYLNFTLWYLRTKHFVTAEDNSDYGITAEGIDFVESHSSGNRVIRDLLTEGASARNAKGFEGITEDCPEDHGTAECAA